MIDIRGISATDRADWQRLWTAYLAYYETEVPISVMDTAFARLLDPETAVHGRLALLQDRPVGLVHYIFHDHMWRPEGVVYLQDLFCDADVRGQGVGKSLIQAVYAAADDAGVPRVYWLTQDFNSTARKLYDSVGKLTPFIRYDRP